MLLAMQAEAVRIVFKAVMALDKSDTAVGRWPFWLFVAIVPFAAATLAAVVTYHQWALGCQLLPTAGDQQPAIDSRADALVQAGLIFFVVVPLVLACAPRRVNEDRRARSAYSFVNTTRSPVLRVFFAALALPAAVLLGLSLLL